MDQYSSCISSTIPSSSSSSSSPATHHLPLFLDSLPFLSPSSLLPFDPSPPPPPPAPPRTPKKRSRASRRAPTTVLTTDTSNFRAMVQEFTGIPSPPFSSSSFLSLPPRSAHPQYIPPPFLIRPFSHKHQITPNTLPRPLPALSSTSNTFLQSLANPQAPLFAAKPAPYPSPAPFSARGEEAQQSRQGGPMLDSWICSSDYK